MTATSDLLVMSYFGVCTPSCAAIADEIRPAVSDEQFATDTIVACVPWPISHGGCLVLHNKSRDASDVRPFAPALGAELAWMTQRIRRGEI